MNPFKRPKPYVLLAEDGDGPAVARIGIRIGKLVHRRSQLLASLAQAPHPQAHLLLALLAPFPRRLARLGVLGRPCIGVLVEPRL